MHIRCLIECLNDIVVPNWSQVSPNFKVFIYLTIFWSKIDLRSWVYYTLHMLHSIGKHLGTHLGTHSCISCYTYICIHTNTHLHSDLNFIQNVLFSNSFVLLFNDVCGMTCSVVLEMLCFCTLLCFGWISFDEN